MPSYCQYVRDSGDPLHAAYHDRQYGFPLSSDDELFCRLVLEINQAGLSWTTILKKQDSFRAAYANFDVAQIAQFTQRDRARLLADPGVIRNRLKVEAAIHNAAVVLDLRKRHGSFAGWLLAQHPQPLEAWTRLFKRTFRFTGGEIVREFLVSTSYLPGAHDQDCPVQARVIRARPHWKRMPAP